MPFKHTHRPEQIVRKSGGGCLMLFGLPFFLAGLLVILASLGLFGGTQDMPWYVGVPFGGVFAAVGLGLMTGRRTILIDGGEGKVTVTTKVFGLAHTKERPTEAMERVTLGKEVRQSQSSKGSSTYIVYPVRLEGSGEKIDLEEPRDMAEARRTAKQVSRLLKLDLHDSVHGQLVVREHDKLDESIRERAKRLDEVVEVPDQPPDTRVEYRIEGRELTLNLPPKGLRGADKVRLGCMMLPAAVPLVIIVAVARQPGLPGAMRAIVGLAFGLFLVIGLLAAVGSALSASRRRTSVTASLDRLRVTHRGLLKTRTVEIPADEIEELLLPSAAAQTDEAFAKLPEGVQSVMTSLGVMKTSGIIARSDDATVEFGQRLSPAEKAWVYAIVKRMLTA